MNILYIDHYAGSPQMGMEFRPYYLAKEWTKMGHKVSMIAGDYSHLRKRNPSVKRDMQKCKIDGIDYYWLKTGRYEGNGVARALTMFRFCIKLHRWSRWINNNLKPDVVISSSTYPIDSIPAYIISKLNKKSKYIHEVHDMWPATLIELGGMSRWNPFVMLMQIGENFAYRHADEVVSLAEYAESYMIQHGLKKGRFQYIPNGIVLEEWEHAKKLPNEHFKKLEEYKKNGKFIVGYFGGHALSNCLMSLVKTAEMIQEKKELKDIQFVLVGDGVEKNKLIEYVTDKSIRNVTFLSSISKQSIPNLVKYFDCTYIGTMNSPLYRFGVCMNKMYDGMMAGKPIIFAINAPQTPVERYKCGIIVNPEDSKDLEKSLKELMFISDKDRRMIGENGKNAVINNFTYKILATQFESLFYVKK